MQLENTEELELTAEAVDGTDGPDWVLFSW
jgi:hypothetical protein